MSKQQQQSKKQKYKQRQQQRQQQQQQRQQQQQQQQEQQYDYVGDEEEDEIVTSDNDHYSNTSVDKDSKYNHDTRILLFKVILSQSDETICKVIQIANGLPGLPQISDISKDLGLIILRLPDKTIKELELYLETKNIYFREVSQSTSSTSSSSSQLQQPHSPSSSSNSSSNNSTTNNNNNNLIIVNNHSNTKSKQKRPIPKQDTYNLIIENDFDLRLIFQHLVLNNQDRELKIQRQQQQSSDNEPTIELLNLNDDEQISPVFLEYYLFIMDCFIILSDHLENTNSTLDDFKNHYKNNENLIKFIEEFKNNLIEGFLDLVEIIASWYIPQKDNSIVKFLNCFGTMLDSTTIETLCYIYNKTIKKEDEWAINFIQSALSSNQEFKKKAMCLNDELIQDRYDESLYSIMHSLKFDNVREFILIYSHDENYFLSEEFWYLICKYDAAGITQHILNNNIAEEDLARNSNTPKNIFKENVLEINPLSLLEICSANFSFKIATVLFQFYDFKDSMPIKQKLRGVTKPNDTSTLLNASSFQYFRILDSNCYFNEITKSRASIFIDLMTSTNIYLNTEVGDGSDENIDSDSIYTYQNSVEYLNINCNNIHNLKKTSISLLSKILEFNDHAILISLLNNLTQGGCQLGKELIDEKQLLITISRPQYNTCLQILNQYWPIPVKYQSREPYIFFAGSRSTLQFLLEIHENSFETIDIKCWIQAIMSAGQYTSEKEFFKFYPKIYELSLKDKYSRTLNILELQYILGHKEGIDLILEEYLGLYKPYQYDAQQLLELFDLNFVQKKDKRSQESIQAELDLIAQEEIEKKKLKDKKKKEKKKQQNNLKQQQQQQKVTAAVVTPVKQTITTTPISTPIKKEVEEIKQPTPPPTLPILAPTSTPIPTLTTQTINNFDISIGKFKFSRKDEYIIGRGSNGTLVFRGIWNNKVPVAIKQMHKAFNPLIGKEIEVLIQLTNKNCNNIVRYIDQEEDDMFVYLGLTLCQGSLQDLVEKQQSLKQFIGSESRLMDLVKDIINGIDFLHSQGIVHNDLNPRNILTKDDRFIISDLGLSKMEVSTSYSFTMHAPTGQEGYHPAEVLLEKRKTKSVDIFSLGCILFYLMCNGQHPFGDKFFRMANILTDKSNLEPLKHNMVACDLIGSMISKNDIDRPTTTTIFQHPFFWNHDKKIKFIDSSLNLFKDTNGLYNSKLNKLINYQNVESSIPFLSKPWNQLIDITLIEHITNKQNQLMSSPSSPSSSLSNSGKKIYFYDYSQIKDLVRCIRNTVQHHKEIQRLIQCSPSNVNNSKSDILLCLESQESVLSYFEQKIPDLLFYLYLKFKKHLDHKSFNEIFGNLKNN